MLNRKFLGVLIAVWAAPALFAQNAISQDARKFVDAGNQAWIDGMKTGDVAPIAKTYAEDGLDCGPTGECTMGRPAVEQRMRDRIAKLGRATSATVTSAGAVQQGDFVYEWGRAEASFSGGNKVSGRYLTVWRREPDGAWRIFRNLSIPPDLPRR